MFEMYPEFIESFNKNLRITFNLRDESQKGVTVSRFARTTRATRDRNIARRLSVVSPQSDEEYGQYGQPVISVPCLKAGIRHIFSLTRSGEQEN